jgi:hypothetical protein
MGASYVYKKFSPLDTAIVPFNAHKQYNYTSASAESYKVSHFNSSYTSQPFDVYSGNSGSDDSINTIKYNQIDHLFYRNHLKSYSNKKDFIHYLKQQRCLYEKANILSIPVGLYGAEIRKSSFYLSSSQYEVTDDGYGNLIISGTKANEYPNDPQQNVFRLDPIKGHKKYDLSVWDDYAKVEVEEYRGSHTILDKKFYRRGTVNPNAPTTYTSENKKYPLGYYPTDEDDSYFFNELNYNNVTFVRSEKFVSLNGDTSKFSSIAFNSSTSSYIEVPHNPRFNFNHDQDYALSFWVKPEATGSNGDISNAEKRYIIAKSTTKKQISSVLGVDTTNTSSLEEYVEAGPQYPFEIYLQSQSLCFQRSDGNLISTVCGEITGSGANDTCQTMAHILCQVSASVMELYYNGTKINSITSNLNNSMKNKANLYIGSKGRPNSFMVDAINPNPAGELVFRTFNGNLQNINIYSTAFTQTQINHISSSVNGSPYIGNLFYQNGFAVITHPNYYDIVSGSNEYSGGINTLQFQGSHLIFEHEYQCTIAEHEYNYTLNTSALKQSSANPYELEGFVTGSYWKPYITTIGLYNDAYELLAVAKLGQPVRCSDETDTTFIIRFDE